MNVKMISKPKQRGSWFRGTCITQKLLNVVDIVVSGDTKEALVEKLKATFVKLLNVQEYVDKSGEKVVRLNEKSKVYVTSRFDVPDGVERDFFNAPEVSVGEALASGRNRRISVTGVVESVSPLKEGGSWKRRDIDLVEAGSRKKLRAKFWGEMSGIEPEVNETVCLRNVRTSIYNDRLSVDSTDETRLEVVEGATLTFCDVIVTAYSPSERPVEIVTATDNVFVVDVDVLETVIGCSVIDFEELLPYSCTVGFFLKTKDVIEEMTSNRSEQDACAAEEKTL